MGLAQIYAMFYFFINIKLILRKQFQIQKYLRRGTVPFFDSHIFNPKKAIEMLLTKF